MKTRFHSTPDHPIQAFTLPELLLAMLITGIVLIIAGTGIVNMLNFNQLSEEDSNQEFEFNRALLHLMNEVRESRQVLSSAPPSTPSWNDPPGYSRVLYLEKPYKLVDQSIEDPADPLDNILAYYVKAPTPAEGWQGEQVIYRRYHDGSAYVMSPVMDGISNAAASNCNAAGTLVGTRGFQARLAGTKVQLCLKSKPKKSGDFYTAQAVVAVRNIVIP